MIFPTDLESINARIQSIDPKAYARTRNFKDGAVSGLSPYISRGVISTKQVFDSLLKRGLPWSSMEKFVQELAWRDYWQQVWLSKGEAINEDLKHPQKDVAHHQIPSALLTENTGIEAVDKALSEFYATGYMHNHMRMYIAAIACNIGQSHWRTPAKWMYSHLLDGDWASNALSWQWVAGSNANKKYIANQENINKYFNSEQRQTFLDMSYEALSSIQVPKELKNTTDWSLTTTLPKTEPLDLDSDLDTLVYNYYNLDPSWYSNEAYNRVLLLDPAFFERYPVVDHCIQFVLDLSKNIQGVQFYVGSFSDLAKESNTHLIYKEHPTNIGYHGTEEPRDWMIDIRGYFPSFFKFWNKGLKQLKSQPQLDLFTS